MPVHGAGDLQVGKTPHSRSFCYAAGKVVNRCRRFMCAATDPLRTWVALEMENSLACVDILPLFDDN